MRLGLDDTDDADVQRRRKETSVPHKSPAIVQLTGESVVGLGPTNRSAPDCHEELRYTQCRHYIGRQVALSLLCIKWDEINATQS